MGMGYHLLAPGLEVASLSCLRLAQNTTTLAESIITTEYEKTVPTGRLIRTAEESLLAKSDRNVSEVPALLDYSCA